MKRFKDILACAALLSVAALLGSSTFILWKAWSLRDEVGKAVAARIDPTLSTVRTVVQQTSDNVNGVVKALPGQVLGEVDRQATGLRSDLRKDVRTADDRLSSVQTTVEDLGLLWSPILGQGTKLLADADKSAALVADALPAYSQCYYTDAAGNIVGGNPDCAFNRFQGVSKAVEKMSLEGAKAAPKVAESVAAIAENTKGVTSDVKIVADKIAKPKGWLAKLLGWLL